VLNLRWADVDFAAGTIALVGAATASACSTSRRDCRRARWPAWLFSAPTIDRSQGRQDMVSSERGHRRPVDNRPVAPVPGALLAPADGASGRWPSFLVAASAGRADM